MSLRYRLSQMLASSCISRSTVTESMAKLAIINLDDFDRTERPAIKALLAVEEQFRIYFHSNRKELELQRIAADTLNKIIQRYKIVTQMEIQSFSPQTYEFESEEVIINKYYMHYQVISCSNKSQRRDIDRMRSFVLNFRRASGRLNMDSESLLILGDAFHKPFKFFMDLVEVLFAYFYSSHLQLDCAARLLDPLDLESLKHYQKLVAPNEDFDDYFLYNISFCKCLRTPPKCPSFEEPEEMADKSATFIVQARKKRCARRRDKMATPNWESHKVDPPSISSGRNPSDLDTINVIQQSNLESYSGQLTFITLGNEMARKNPLFRSLE
ncbi:uncharacterized protein LOC108109156 [Drosophila eugracilis]|uniref:uncharacterized protein LOC108109156 n=1 Tax=Drosophila eugracilis TaxID=29029 RepID=UPI0007E8A9EF|nr:uncharacterized protein LOC108109156 [Drosophila eugracilis]